MAWTAPANGGALKLDRTKLQRAREMLGYGIETTAEKAGVSKNSVLRAEHEEDIRPVTARKIAEALKVEVRDLLPLGQPPPLEVSSTYFVPPAEGDEPDIVTLQFQYVRLMEENDRLLQTVRRLEREKAEAVKELEKAGRKSA